MRLFPVVVALTLLTAPLVALADDGAIQITFNGAMDSTPAWSPDGSQIAFQSRRDYGIWVIPSTGGTATPISITPNPHNVLWHPTWSPDGSQIAFVGASIYIGFCRIYTAPSLGGEPTEIIDGGLAPDWSPDGSQIAFQYYYGGWPQHIWTIPSGGGYGTQITFGEFHDGAAAWSSDGTQIAFQSDRSGNQDIWVVPSSGGTATQVTFDPGEDFGPAWSGNLIAFSSDRSGNRDIWVIPSTGGTATQITSDPAMDLAPSWSPDGTQIAFESNRSGNHDIWVIDVEPPVTVEQESWGMVKSKYHE